jgi:hypothetical protein
MPTKFTVGARVRHKTYGLGTVSEVAGDDSLRVEFDNDPTIRTFMVSLGTLTLADETAPEHPPTDQVQKPEAALLRAKARNLTTTSPEAPAVAKSIMRFATDDSGIITALPMENPMPDHLITAMNAALAERGKGAIAGLTATLGISKNTPNNWRHLGRIPDHQRAPVQAWIDKGQILAIRVEKLKPAPKAKPVIKSPPKLRIVKSLKPDELRPSDVPPIRSAIDHETVLQALGLTITAAWLPEGETMRQVRVAVLP